MHFFFADLVKKYSVPCTLISFGRGAYEAGEYEEGTRTDTEVTAAVIPMSQRQIQLSGGSLTSADRDLYVLKKSDKIDLESGQTYYIGHNGKIYRVLESGQYGEDYADFNKYTLKRVEAFGTGKAGSEDV